MTSRSECDECEGTGWIEEIGHSLECYRQQECICNGVPMQVRCEWCEGEGDV